MKQNNYGIPLAVRVRTLLPQLLIAAVTLIAYVLMLLFTVGDVTRAAAELRRRDNSPTNEIVLSYEKNPGESFYYLKNYAVSGSRATNAVSDIYMVCDGAEYSRNSISFSSALGEGCCAVSANIASRYGLGIGATARIIGTDKTFTVTDILPAQAGIDEDYLHEGIVVLAFDGELLDRSYLYASFLNDGDAYRSLYRLIYVEDMAEGALSAIAVYAAAAIAVTAAAMLLSETLLARSRRRDYSYLVALGKRPWKLLLTVLSENLIKYLLPAVLALSAYAVSYSAYEECYLYPALFLVLVSTLGSIVYSLITVRRLYYVRAKSK